MTLFEDMNRNKANIFWHLIDIFSGLISVIGLLYESHIGKEYEKEKNTFHLKNNQSILHIGCGAYPITAIIFSKYTNKKIVAIDKNPFVVRIANAVVKKKHLEDKIIIEHGEGSNYKIGNFDIIIVSSCSIPKEKVIENVVTNAKKPSTIIIRELFSEITHFKQILQSYSQVKKNGEIDCHVFPNLHWISFCFSKN
jgi:precorrin-6B methylase 2